MVNFYDIIIKKMKKKLENFFLFFYGLFEKISLILKKKIFMKKNLAPTSTHPYRHLLGISAPLSTYPYRHLLKMTAPLITCPSPIRYITPHKYILLTLMFNISTDKYIGLQICLV